MGWYVSKNQETGVGLVPGTWAGGQRLWVLRGFAASHHPAHGTGSTSLRTTLNTPFAVAMQRLSTVTSVPMNIRLLVMRTTRGFEIMISPMRAASTKWVSI